MGQLTAMRIKAIKEPGRYTDGDGLMLVVPTGAKTWVVRLMSGGKRRDLGLGSLKLMSLAEARAKALELRRQIAQGTNPMAERRKVADPVPTFRAALSAYTRNTKADCGLSRTSGMADSSGFPLILLLTA